MPAIAVDQSTQGSQIDRYRRQASSHRVLQQTGKLLQA
ncbi:hypothetical protein C4K03_6100 [Pseudomonas synxantha]|uniref:Uncharacterized protein n=1 Tax=Pseudomonas synxantha TaxID=47883 RepID=A0A3G7UFL8_9PSED|nr:hypothetical protein C4K03_6100 [Pseudomonas synxantha]